MPFGVVEDIRVIGTEPHNGGSHVSIETKIKVWFSQAVDPSTLNTGTFVVARNSITPIAGTVTYERTWDGKFIGIFTPERPLDPRMSYQVTMVGISHPFTGGTNSVIKNIVGNSLGKNFVFQFSTGDVAFQPPALELPVEFSSIRNTRPHFRWAEYPGATAFQIIVGTSELMDPLYVPPGSSMVYPIDIPGSVRQWIPDQAFEDNKQYFWKIRAQIGDVWTAWSVLHSFSILERDEQAPYIPGVPAGGLPPAGPAPDPTVDLDGDGIPDVPGTPFTPGVAGAYDIMSGTGQFEVIDIEPPPGSLNWPGDYLRLTFNRPIDPDSLTADKFVLKGAKMQQSNPNTREPGIVTIQNIYVDEDEPNVVIVVPEGGSPPPGSTPLAPGAGTIGGINMIEWFENLFMDILHASKFKRGWGKHFMEITDRVQGQDNLYTDLRQGQLRLSRNTPYPTGDWISTAFEVQIPVNINLCRFLAEYTYDDTDTDIRFEISSDDGVTYQQIIINYDPAVKIQRADVSLASVTNKLRLRISMRSQDNTKTPLLRWFMVLFDGVI